MGGIVMDTASHLLLGVTLAGLAHVSPTVAENPLLAQAVMIGTVIGSHAPDFDTLVRMRGMATYIRYHRGITHSIPALFLWPAAISLPLVWAYGLQEHALTLYVWTWVAVVFHVFLDMLNSYGVQSIRPFSRKWVHLDVLAICEPPLLLLHAAAAIWWIGFAGDPARIFPAAYALTLMYIAVRAWQHRQLVRDVQDSLGVAGICHVTPSFHPFHWRFVVETEHCFYTGKIMDRRILLEEIYSKEKSNEIIQATMGSDGVRAFLGFAQRIHVTWKELHDGYEVKWSDVRFWYDRNLPFGVDVRLDRNLNVVTHKLGWRKKAWDPPFV
jgi:inner membrane protein